ncbi:MAG: MFS transporter [Janthinobacterium lividum]
MPKSEVGTAGGFMHGLANLSGIIGPAVTGILIERTGTYAAGFGLAGGLGVIGTLIVACFVRQADPHAAAPRPAV